MARRKRNNSSSGNRQGLSEIEQAFVSKYSMQDLSMIKSLDVEKVKYLVAESNANVLKAKREMEATSEYKKATETLAALRGGFSDLKKMQEVRRMLGLEILSTHGIVDIGEVDPEKGE